jgi:hypothetical protein
VGTVYQLRRGVLTRPAMLVLVATVGIGLIVAAALVLLIRR